MTSATLPPVVTTSSTTSTRAPGRTVKLRRKLITPCFALAEDELDAERLRHGEADDDAADRRGGDKIDLLVSNAMRPSPGRDEW